ncbi:MAG: DMT family transporter [Oscillospiraceae bacterium]|jgi:drug/metabolite transporter (DMT)-like permease|nr:DMT family transporter [Oscillospiraceae bacterium]
MGDERISGMKPRVKDKYFILLAAVLWSTAGLGVKLLSWNAFSISCVRGMLCALVLLAIRFKDGNRTAPSLNRYNILAGLFMFATSSLYVLSIKLTTAANAIVLQYIAPIAVLLYNILMKQRKPTRADIALTAVVFGGCVLTFAGQLERGGMLGNALALLSGFMFAGQIIVNNKRQTNQQDGLLIGCALSFVVYLPFVFFDAGFTLTPVNIMAGLFLGLVQYGIANLCFARGIRTTDAVTASLLLTIEPVLSPVWVMLTIREVPAGYAIAGFICVIAAVTAHNIYPLIRFGKNGNTS